MQVEKSHKTKEYLEAIELLKKEEIKCPHLIETDNIDFLCEAKLEPTKRYQKLPKLTMHCFCENYTMCDYYN